MTRPPSPPAGPSGRPSRKNAPRKRLRIVPVMMSIALASILLALVLAGALLEVNRDIVGLANRSTDELLPRVRDEMRTAINLERLRVFGEIVHSSPLARDRREALLAARILVFDTAFEQSDHVKGEIKRVLAIIEEIARLRAQAQGAALPGPADEAVAREAGEAWHIARGILNGLVQQLSTGAAAATSDSVTQIAERAHWATQLMALGMFGMTLIFCASVYFVRRAVVKPILRVTKGLDQVRALQGTVRMRREGLQELDDIAQATEGFGTALERVREHTAALEREIAERQLVQARLQALATTDDLTGLTNRRHFIAIAEQELERARRYKLPLALVMMDADHFKVINDRFGHHAGDVALQTLAKVGLGHLREVDTLARIGGEEFALLLPQTGSPEALSVAERLRQAIADAPIECEAGRIHLTISLGVATLDAGTVERIEQLMQMADTALYRAKANGRNRVESASPPA